MKSWLIRETLVFLPLLPSSLFAIVFVVQEIPNEVTSFILSVMEQSGCVGEV